MWLPGAIAKMYFYNSKNQRKIIELEPYSGPYISIPTCSCIHNMNFFKQLLIKKAEINNIKVKAIIGYNLNRTNLETTINKQEDTCSHCGFYPLWVRTDKQKIISLKQNLDLKKTRTKLKSKNE